MTGLWQIVWSLCPDPAAEKQQTIEDAARFYDETVNSYPCGRLGNIQLHRLVMPFKGWVGSMSFVTMQTVLRQ